MKPDPGVALLFSRLWKIAPERVKTVICPAALLAVALLVSAGPLWRQAATSVRGVVNDPTGGAVSGATVTLTNTESKI